MGDLSRVVYFDFVFVECVFVCIVECVFEVVDWMCILFDLIVVVVVGGGLIFFFDEFLLFGIVYWLENYVVVNVIGVLIV